MTVTENNPHKISTMGTGTSLAAVTDASDFPHTGLIKGLSQMARQNIVVKGSNDSATHDFNITQASSGNVIQVAQGSYLRDGKLYTASAANFTIGTTSNDTSLLASSQFDKGYHLLVINSSNAIKIRQPTVADKVPDYTSGDTIIAIIEVASTTSDGSRKIQFLTSDKTDNSVSIAYANSNTYTEVGSITGASGGTTITSTGTLTLDADDTKITASSDGKPTLTLENTAGVASAANEPEIIFNRTGASDASTSGDLGRIMFKGKDDGNAIHTYAQITGEALDETGGTEDGRLRFITALGGADNTEFLRISGSEGVIFNHDKNNIDFSIMGDTNDHVLNVDAGTEKVGIGVNDAKTRLTVEGAITLKEQANADADTAAYGQIWTKTATPNELYFTNDAGNDIQLTTGATGPLLTGKHSIWVPAEAISPRSNAGCADLATTAAASNGRPDIRALAFDKTSTENGQFTIAMPKMWDEGTITFRAYWTNASVTSGGVTWGLKGVSLSDDDAINADFGTIVYVDDTQTGAAKDVHITGESNAVSISGSPAANDLTFFQIERGVSESNDTLNEDALLMGIKIFYTIDSGNDA